MTQDRVMIGLEIHGYLNMKDTKQKLFCNCKIDEEQNAIPNTNICPRCTGQPGSKPNLPNSEAIQKVVKCALMLGCRVNQRLVFQRKHYSYPDSPNNYQRTMSGSYATPTGEEGEFLGIRITECHLEEDPARYDLKSKTVDFNRCGYPLIEIVTEPDFKDSEEVRVWLRRLMTTLSYIDGVYENMGIKCDVNVSSPGHPRVEVKNVNSRSAIVEAIEHEIKRQKELVDKNEAPDYMQTRGWVDLDKTTRFLRKKETATQYMFIPEPDLPAVEISDEYLNEIKSGLPMRPDEKVELYQSKGLTQEQAIDMASDIYYSSLFDKLIEDVETKVAFNLITRFTGILTSEADEEKVNHILQNELINLESELKPIANSYAKQELHNQNIKDYFTLVVNKLVEDEKIVGTADKFIEENKVSTDGGEIDAWVKEAIDENPAQVEQIKGGNDKLVNFLVGQVMKKAKGKANPGIAKSKLEEALK